MLSLGHTFPSTSWRMLNLLHIHLPHVLPVATLQLLLFPSLVFLMTFHHHPVPQCLLTQQNQLNHNQFALQNFIPSPLPLVHNILH
jgi:hypothetical protein